MALDRNNPAELIERAREYPLTHEARTALLIEACAVGVAFLIVKATSSESNEEAAANLSPDPEPKPDHDTASVPASPSTPRRRPKSAKSTESPEPPHASQTP